MGGMWHRRSCPWSALSRPMSLCHPQQPPSLLWLLLLQSLNLPKSHPRGTSAVLHKRQVSAALWEVYSSQHEMVQSHLAEGLREAMGLFSKPFGRHGNCFFPPCASPQGSNQCMHVGLKSQIKSQAAASCREPTCHSSSHIVTASWHCSHSSHTLLQTQVPDTVCCHQRAPPAPFASTCVCHHALCTTLQSSARRIIYKKGTAQGVANSSPPAQTWWDSWFRGTKKALPSPTSQVQSACTSCSTCGTAEGLFVLSSLQKKHCPLTSGSASGLGVGPFLHFGPFFPPPTGCCKTSQGASV